MSRQTPQQVQWQRGKGREVLHPSHWLIGQEALHQGKLKARLTAQKTEEKETPRVVTPQGFPDFHSSKQVKFMFSY